MSDQNETPNASRLDVTADQWEAVNAPLQRPPRDLPNLAAAMADARG